MLSPATDWTTLEDDDPCAPWMVDRRFGGMSPAARRASWQAEQEREPSEAQSFDDDDAPPHAGPEDYGLPSDEVPDPPAADPQPIQLVSAADWPDEAPPPVSWVVSEKIPRGDVSTLDGDGGLGKTMVALQLGTAITLRRTDWFGFEVVDCGSVIFLSAEEPEAEIRRRVYRLAKRAGLSLTGLRDLQFWFPDNVGECLFAMQTPAGGMQPTPLFRAMAAKIDAERPALVIVDNVAAIYGGDQNNRGQVRGFMNMWRAVARSSGAAILLLNHPSLSGLNNGSGRGGSMDWRNSVRAALHLKPAPEQADADRGVRVLECVKNNYAPLGSPVRLEWVDGVLTVEGTASPLQRAAQDAQADEKFLEMLARHNRLGLDVGPSTGRGYAPAVFEAAPDNGGYKARAFAATMHRLLTAGRIEVREEGPPSKRRKRLAIAGQGKVA